MFVFRHSAWYLVLKAIACISFHILKHVWPIVACPALGPAAAPGTGARVGRLRTEQLAPSAAVAVSSTAGIWPPLLAASRPPSRKVYFLHRKDRGQERGENKDPKLKSQITL